MGRQQCRHPRRVGCIADSAVRGARRAPARCSGRRPAPSGRSGWDLGRPSRRRPPPTAPPTEAAADAVGTVGGLAPRSPPAWRRRWPGDCRNQCGSLGTDSETYSEHNIESEDSTVLKS